MMDLEKVSNIEIGIDEVSRDNMEILNTLRDEIREPLSNSKKIGNYTTTTIGFVATDGGTNSLNFDPFEIQVVRVVDSKGREGCLNVVSRYTDIEKLSQQQFNNNGEPVSALGELMEDLKVDSLRKLSPMLDPKNEESEEILRSGWVNDYRELWEWAVIYNMFKQKRFVTDTLIVIDGLLRSKIFKENLFIQMINKINTYIKEIYREERCEIYLAGVAKHSKVLERYQLAMMLEGILRETYPVYVEVPTEIEKYAYDWEEYARRPGEEEGGEEAKFVGGRLYLVKFGPRPGDPIWPVDILIGHEDKADKIIGCLKNNAEEGFPIPYYPKCIQKAHTYSALDGLDMDILQKQIIDSLRGHLSNEEDIKCFEEFILRPKDIGGKRYE